MKHAIVITGKNYGFVTFSTSAPVEQLLEMSEPFEVAGSKVMLRQVILGSIGSLFGHSCSFLTT